VGAALCEHLGAGVERIAQRDLGFGRGARLRLRLVDDEAPAHRVIGVLEHDARVAVRGEAHRVRVVGQAHRQQAHVPRPVERDRHGAGEHQRAFGTHAVDRADHEIRIDGVRSRAHQAGGDRAIGRMADAGRRQRAVELHLDASHLAESPVPLQCRGEIVRRAHRSDGVRTRRPDTDLEQVEDAD